MKVEVKENNLYIKGDITTLKDVEKIKENYEKFLKNFDKVSVYIVNSVTLPSTLISYFYNLQHKNKLENLKVNEKLYLDLEELNIKSDLKMEKLKGD